MVDVRDLKSLEPKGSCRFESCLGHMLQILKSMDLRAFHPDWTPGKIEYNPEHYINPKDIKPKKVFDMIITVNATGELIFPYRQITIDFNGSTMPAFELADGRVFNILELSFEPIYNVDGSVRYVYDEESNWYTSRIDFIPENYHL